MKVFLSWAGERSKHIAQTLYTWLPQVIQTLEPWMSTRIDKGDSWDGAIADALDSTPIGILALTPESLDSKYLHYEAGAIANVKGSKVCTLLIGLKDVEVKQPLARFQHTQADKDDVLILLKTINEKIKERGEKSLSDDQLRKSLELNWPEFELALKCLPAEPHNTQQRPQIDMVEEILQTVRDLDQKLDVSNRMLELDLLFNDRNRKLDNNQLDVGVPYSTIKKLVASYTNDNSITTAKELSEQVNLVGKYIKDFFPASRLKKELVMRAIEEIGDDLIIL